MLLYLLYRDNLYVTEVVQRKFFLRGRLCFSLVSFILGIAGLVMDQESSALCRDYIIDTCENQIVIVAASDAQNKRDQRMNESKRCSRPEKV